MAVKKSFFKYNPATDGNKTFDIEEALNKNWDKVNEGFSEMEEYIDTAIKEIKPAYQEYLMIASGWTENAYSFENVYPSETYDIEISLSSSATNEMVEAFNSATITGSVESNIVTAFGDIPTIDILVIVKVVEK